MYLYPLTMEAKIDIEIPAAADREVRAWELILGGEKTSYDVREALGHLGPGFIALVWSGSVLVQMRGADDLPLIEPGLGFFSLAPIEKIVLGADATAARVAVFGVIEAVSTPPDIQLPPRGRCDIHQLPMPPTPDGSQQLTAILRRLQLSNPDQDPTPPNPELWPRPGFFLTTIDGPQAGDPCSSETSVDGDGGLDFILLDAGASVTYQHGRDPNNVLAYIIDFYGAGDDVQGRGPFAPTPGCNIRCWGP